MATTTVLSEEQMEVVQPEEDIMFDRKGFDRGGIRREFASTVAIDPSTKYVEEGSATFVHPDSDYAQGDTAEGETLGTLELVKETGKNVKIPRYTHGFTYDVEDGEVDSTLLSDMRDAIMELFMVEADLAFFNGIYDEQGNAIFEGVFEWLQNNMDAENIIDCSDYDPSAGDLDGVQANIITEVAYGKITGEYVTAESPQWDIAAAKHPVWSKWNSYGTYDGAMVESQWNLVQADRNDAQVGVNRRNLVPPEIGLRGPRSMNDDLMRPVEMPGRVNDSYSSPLDSREDYSGDDDVMWLIPRHNGDFYELYEQGTPDSRGPIEKDGWQERYEYKWRGGVVQGFSQRAEGNAVDVVKLENVTALFE